MRTGVHEVVEGLVDAGVILQVLVVRGRAGGHAGLGGGGVRSQKVEKKKEALLWTERERERCRGRRERREREEVCAWCVCVEERGGGVLHTTIKQHRTNTQRGNKMPQTHRDSLADDVIILGRHLTSS